MVSKRFDKELYAKWDVLSRKYAKRELKKIGFSTEDNTQKYGVDIIVNALPSCKFISINTFFAEVEMKTSIKHGEVFAYDTLNLPERKKKFCGLEHPTLFILFSECGKSLLCCWDEYVSRCPLEEVKNKYVSVGEKFFKIPMEWVDNSIEKALQRKAVSKNG